MTFSKLILISVVFTANAICADEDLNKKLDSFAGVACSPKETVYNTYNLSLRCIQNNIPGDFVECGVAAGAQIAAMGYACQKLDSNRKILLFDSFEGIPLAGPNDTQQPGVGYLGHNTNVKHIEDLLVSSRTVYPNHDVSDHSVEKVKNNMKRFGIQEHRLVYYKGWFQHVLPIVAPMMGNISLLRLDGDLYESTKVCLEYLYPKVSKGGYIIIDDYNLEGCKKAVDEYLKAHNIFPKMTLICSILGGLGPIYWQVE